MKKKLFMSGMLAVALMGSAFSANHTAHASTLKPHQTTPFASIDSTVHLDAVTATFAIGVVPGIITTFSGEGLLVGVHYECPLNPATGLPQAGTMTVTASQAGANSGDGETVITSTGSEPIVCNGIEHEVVVNVPPVFTPTIVGGVTTGVTVTDFNDGPVSITASGALAAAPLLPIISDAKISDANEH